MELGYWDCKGKAEVVRWLCSYLAIEFTEWSPASPEEWKEKKLALSLQNPFINLPYILDGETLISESKAVHKYIILKANRPEMYGEGEADQVQVQTLQGYL